MSQAVHCNHTNLSIGKTVGELWGTRHFPWSRCTSHESLIRANSATASLQWNVLQRHQWSEALAWITVLSSGWMWRESGTTSKTKKQICLCPSRLPEIKKVVLSTLGLTRTNTVARRLFPFLNAKAAGTSLYRPCFLTWSPLKEWVSSSVHHNAPGSRGQGARLLWC